MPEDNSTAQHM